MRWQAESANSSLSSAHKWQWHCCFQWSRLADGKLIRHFASQPAFHLSFRFQSMSGYSEEHLRSKLQEKLAAEHVEVTDVSDGCGGKFEVVIGEAIKT